MCVFRTATDESCRHQCHKPQQKTTSVYAVCGTVAAVAVFSYVPPSTSRSSRRKRVRKNNWRGQRLDLANCQLLTADFAQSRRSIAAKKSPQAHRKSPHTCRKSPQISQKSTQKCWKSTHKLGVSVPRQWSWLLKSTKYEFHSRSRTG